jgi:hypothetical protein
MQDNSLSNYYRFKRSCSEFSRQRRHEDNVCVVNRSDLTGGRYDSSVMVARS